MSLRLFPLNKYNKLKENVHWWTLSYERKEIKNKLTQNLVSIGNFIFHNVFFLNLLNNLFFFLFFCKIKIPNRSTFLALRVVNLIVDVFNSKTPFLLSTPTFFQANIFYTLSILTETYHSGCIWQRSQYKSLRHTSPKINSLVNLKTLSSFISSQRIEDFECSNTSRPNNHKALHGLYIGWVYDWEEI